MKHGITVVLMLMVMLYRNGMILPASQVKIYYPPEISHEDKGANSFVMGISSNVSLASDVTAKPNIIILITDD